MADAGEAVLGAIEFIVGGFILLVFAQAFAGTVLDTGVVDLGLLGVVTILGGVVVIVTFVAGLIAHALT